MTEQELFGEMFTLLMAGIETMTTSLIWLFYHLLPRADVMAKVRAERDREVGRNTVIKVGITHILARLEMRLAPGYRMHPAFDAIAIAPSGGTPVIVDGRFSSALTQKAAGPKLGGLRLFRRAATSGPPAAHPA